jgi:hypothetical protein
MGWASDVFHPEAHLPMLSPRGRQQTNFSTPGQKTRASGVPTKELSAQLARESCSVTGVGSCYPVSHSERTTKISSVRPRIAQGLASLRKSIVRYYSDIDNLCRSDGGNASCSMGIFDKLNTHLLGTYSAEKHCRDRRGVAC